MRSEKKVLKLKHPVMFGTEEISEIEIRKPVTGDLRKFPAEVKNLGQILDFAAHLTGLNAVQIDMLDLEDGMKLFEEIMGFLPDSLRTGVQP